MKFSSKLIVALVLTLAISVVGISVWAAPLRQGTVPITPDTVTIEGIIPVTGGTYQVTLLGNCEAVGTVTRIIDPEKEVGPAPEGFEFLTDGVRVELDKVCNVEICYPYPTEYKEMNGDIFRWKPLLKTWDVGETKISGDPEQICVIDEIIDQAAYVMLGK